MALRPVWSDERHRVFAGDVEEGAGRELAELAKPVAAVYTDPPWNAGIAQQFRKWAKVPRPVDFPALLAETARVLASALADGAPGFVQMGERGLDATLTALDEVGLVSMPYPCGQVTDSWEPLRGAWLIGVGSGWVPGQTWDDDDAWTVLCRRALSPHVPEGGTVMDPYLGFGVVLRVADVQGWRCVGADLSEDRVRRGVKRLERDRRGAPEAVFGPSE